MSNYKIVVDSCCEIPEEIKKDLLIERVPLTLEVGDATIIDDETFDFSFTLDNEISSTNNFGEFKEGMYLYEPYPAIMKLQPFKLISQQFNAIKLHQHTHLYASTEVIADFPGDCHKIERIYPFSSRTIKEVVKDYPRANVAVRNFILSADELRKRLKIKDDNKYRLYGVSVANGDRLLIVTTRI